MLDRVAAFFLNRPGGRQAGSAIAVIAVVAVGSFLGVRSEQHRTDRVAGAADGVSFSIADGAQEVRGDRALVFTSSRPLPLQSVMAALHIQPAAQGNLVGSPDGRRFTWQPSPPLADGTKYTVMLDSPRDARGHVVRGGVWHFETATVPRTVGAPAPGSRRLRVPALVQIANDVASRDQSGLQSADAVYEYLTEGGITRFTAVFSRTPEVVGPVHGGRLISVKLARRYRGMLFMSDLSRGSTARLSADPVPTSLDAGDTFYRSTDRPAPDNLFVTGASMERAEERLGLAPAGPISAGVPWFSGDPGAEVSVSEHRSIYTYDPGSGTYTKVEDGHRLQDTATGGAPVRIRLLVVLHTSARQTSYPEDAGGHRGLDFDLDSGGALDLYLGGKHTSGRWSASDPHSPLGFSLTDGTTLYPPDGLTWVDVVTS